MKTPHVHDFAAVGLGPFNLGLACLAAPLDDLDGVFLDQRPGFDWHPGMMLESATVQTPFLADLVTLADPTSPFSFLAHAKEEGRIYSFYIRESFHLLRHEFNRYCQWAVERLAEPRWNVDLRWNTRVEEIAWSPDESADGEEGFYVLRARHLPDDRPVEVRARKLVLGTGTVPHVPDVCRDLPGAVHSSNYLDHKKRLQAEPSITVVGSGQSAAEIVHDLLGEIDVHGYALRWITRSPRFFPLEYSKLTLEMTSPDYVDYFHSLPPATRDRLIARQAQLYKGIDDELISEIFDLLYSKRLLCECEVELATHRELVGADWRPEDGLFDLELFHTEQRCAERRRSAGLVLATGYAYRRPEFVDGIAERIRWDEKGRFDVARNYSIDPDGREIFVQNAELHTHGLVTPDLGMAAYRNSWILREITGREVYPIEERIAFQRFAAARKEDTADVVADDVTGAVLRLSAEPAVLPNARTEEAPHVHA